MTGAFAWPTTSVGMFASSPGFAFAGAPQTCTTAGPPVMKSLAPSMFAGSGGIVRLCFAAACRVASALNV